MSLVRRAETEVRAAKLSDVLASDRRRGSATFAGRNVNDTTAMQLSAVWACVDIIADQIATLPIREVKKQDGVLIPTGNEPPILFEPSTEYAAMDWRRAALYSLLLRGNAISKHVSFDRRGFVQQSELVNLNDIGYRRSGPMAPIQWILFGKETPRDMLLHVPAYTIPGVPVGLAPIEHARQAIGLGLATEEFGARWFGDGAHPTGQLTTDKKFKSPEDADRHKDRFMAAIRGREVVALSDGLKYEQIQVTPEQSQFLETTNANVRTIARFFGVQPEAIGGDSGGNSITYSNVEQRALTLTTFTHRKWVRRLEVYLSSLLPRGREAQIMIDDIHAADILVKTKVADINVRGGQWSVDEARATRNEPPLPNGAGQERVWPPGATGTASTEPSTNNEGV